jgi:hypothetical protein
LDGSQRINKIFIDAEKVFRGKLKEIDTKFAFVRRSKRKAFSVHD